MTDRKTVLLLGGSGFIGSNLTTHFLKSGWEVVSVARGNHSFLLKEEKGTLHQLGYIDYTETDTLAEVFDEYSFDLVVHLISTAIPATSFAQFYNELDVNLMATIRLVELMQTKSVNKLVFFSSGGVVYGDNGRTVNDEQAPTEPINFYGWQKISIEKYLQICHLRYGLEYLILRPSNPYGKFQHIHGKQGFIAVALGSLLENRPLTIWGDGSAVRDYIFIEDLCEAVMLLIETDSWNAVYNIGSGEGHSINEVLEGIRQILNQEIQIIFETSRTVDIATNVLDISKLKKAINWMPKTPLSSGIQQMWKWIHTINQSLI